MVKLTDLIIGSELKFQDGIIHKILGIGDKKIFYKVFNAKGNEKEPEVSTALCIYQTVLDIYNSEQQRRFTNFANKELSILNPLNINESKATLYRTINKIILYLKSKEE